MAYSLLGRGFLTGAITSREDLAEDDWRRQPQQLGDRNVAPGDQPLLVSVSNNNPW